MTYNTSKTTQSKSNNKGISRLITGASFGVGMTIPYFIEQVSNSIGYEPSSLTDKQLFVTGYLIAGGCAILGLIKEYYNENKAPPSGLEKKVDKYRNK